MLARAGRQMFPEIFHNLFNHRGMWPREKEQVFGTFAGCGKDNQVLGEKLWLVCNHRSFQIDDLGERSAILAGQKMQLSRLLVRGDQRAEKIWWDTAAPPANAGSGPGDGLAEQVFTLKDQI